jgi:hypothetical protein
MNNTMDEFLLIFRRDYKTKEGQLSPDQLQEQMKDWLNWFKTLTAEDRLARPPQRWDGEGVLIDKNKTVTNGPYAEIKESIGGMIMIKAANYEEAAEIAKNAPVIKYGGNVEIRKAF